ncbi:MAG: DUF6398 domain-containing protein [Microbacteriaceae bacterium]
MAGKRKSNQHDPHRISTRTTSRQSKPSKPSKPSEDVDELRGDQLLDGIDRALQDSHPLALLSMASGIAAALDRRGRHPMAPPESALPTLEEFCETLIEAGLRETDALLLALGRMTADDLLLRRITRAVAGRRHPIPSWLTQLDEVRPYRAVETTHLLGDGDNVVIGVRLPGNRECTLLVYIDHNVGTVVKDAFVINRPIDEVIGAWGDADPRGDAEIGELPKADARARVSAAIERGRMTFPPLESDSWPGIRAFTEWIIAMLPAGGTGYLRPDWTADQLAAVTDDFFATPVGNALDDGDNRSLLGSILCFGTDYGSGDPLRWSPAAVEILLDDWLARNVVAAPQTLSRAPQLVRAFICYCHTERGISGELTEQTLDAVDVFEPSYLETIRPLRRPGPISLLERIGGLAAAESDTADPGSPPSAWGAGLNERELLDLLAAAVGGVDALRRLDARPLPDEPLCWDGIPTGIHPRVAEVVELADGCCARMFDTELRTAARRLLARIAVGDPTLFRRRSVVVTAAATVCWIIGRANNSFDYLEPTRRHVKDLMAHFALTGGLSQFVAVMLRAIGADWRNAPQRLTDPALLVSRERADIIALRDVCLAALH